MLADEELDIQLKKATSAREKVDLIIQFCFDELDLHTGGDFARRVAQGQELLKTIDYPRGEAYMTIFYAYKLWLDFDLKAMRPYADKGLELFRKLDDEKGLISAYCIHTFGTLARGNYDEAFQSALEGVKLAEKSDEFSFSAWVYYLIGVVYFDISDYENAVRYYEKGLEVFNRLNHEFGRSRTKPGLGSCYLELGRYEEAKVILKEGIADFTKNYNAEGLSRTINDLGAVYVRTGEYEEAEEQLQKAYEIRKGLTNNRGLNTTLMELANLRIRQDRNAEAIDLLREALEISTGNDAKPKQLKAWYLLYKAYKNNGNVEEAFDALENYLALKDEVSSAETNHKLKMQESNFASEKAEQIAALEKEKNRQLKQAHDQIAEKQKEITDSIKYAKRIQHAILPSSKLIKEHLPESFVLYKPKDIVAGDFYWMQVVEEKVLFAAADCTGHGVPGAMVSVICNNGLNRSVNEFGLTDPGQILDQTRNLVIAEFEKSEEEVKDGMDIALCTLHSCSHSDSHSIIEYAGANNPLWLIREGELIERKADKQPIGKYAEHSPFTTYEIELGKGDCIYIFSDGFADQFGGPKGKKFKAANFKNLLLSIQNHPMEKQCELINEAFENWKGNLEQVDDVCIIGVRI